MGPTGKVFTVEIFPTETCSCLIPHAACSHVLAVKTALRMDTGKKSLASTSVGLVRTKAIGKAKSGRKQPRPGDIKVVESSYPEPIPEMDEPVSENQEELVDIAIASKNEHVPEQVQENDEQENKEIRKSIESDIKQKGTSLSNDAIARIKGEVDNGWLDDSVIDCAQYMLHKQFPFLDGLQSCCYAEKPCFKPVVDSFIQILNTHPKDGGSSLGYRGYTFPYLGM